MPEKIKRVLKRSKYLPHGVAAALSIIIIGVIVFAPAASALTVEILGAANNQKVGRHGTFQFVAHIQLSSDELIPLQTLNIILNGDTFSFDPRTGKPIGTESPAIISVIPVNFPVGQPSTKPYGYTYGYFLGFNDSQPSYGYPYAYGYGVAGPRTINYLIVLDLSKLPEGPNTIQMNVVTALSPVSTYWSSEVTINVVDMGKANKGSFTLNFQGYDYDNKGEVSILVNNQEVAVLPEKYAPQNNNVYANYSLDISHYIMPDAPNTITFKQNIYSSAVRNVVVENFNTTIYSNATRYSMWMGGRETVNYTFLVGATYTISWKGYDYDNKQEVTVTLNGQVVGTLPSTSAPDNNNKWRSFNITADNMQVNNTLTFTQNVGSSKIRTLMIRDPDGKKVFSSVEERSLWLPNETSTTYTFSLP